MMAMTTSNSIRVKPRDCGRAHYEEPCFCHKKPASLEGAGFVQASHTKVPQAAFPVLPALGDPAGRRVESVKEEYHANQGGALKSGTVRHIERANDSQPSDRNRDSNRQGNVGSGLLSDCHEPN